MYIICQGKNIGFMSRFMRIIWVIILKGIKMGLNWTGLHLIKKDGRL